jgi:Protein of unknown function (DUF3102)
MTDAYKPITTISALNEHATAIRQLGKRVVADVIEIGRRLTDAKHICGRGNWLPWLKNEFGWSVDTAERFIQLYALSSQIPQIAEFNLPLSGLYLLAAPSTPEKVRTEVIERAKAGEMIKFAEVKETIDTANGRKPQAKKAREQPKQKDVASPEEIKSNIFDTIERQKAVARAYKKVFKVATLDQAAKDEVSAAIGTLITTWQMTRPRPAKKKREIIDERQSLVRRLVALDRDLVMLLSKFFETYPDQVDGFVADLMVSQVEIEEHEGNGTDAQASADRRKAEHAARDGDIPHEVPPSGDGLDIPDILRRRAPEATP